MRVAAVVVLSNEERVQLRQWSRSRTVSVRLTRRAQIVLGAADGLDNETIAAQLGVGRVQVGRWRTRYAEGGLAAIQQDLRRGGRPVKVDAGECPDFCVRGECPDFCVRGECPDFCVRGIA